MKKRIIITSLILCLLFFAYKKISNFLTNDEIDENVFLLVKSQNNIFENWLIYTGILLILISITGIIITLKPIKKVNCKNQKFENLYS